MKTLPLIIFTILLSAFTAKAGESDFPQFGVTYHIYYGPVPDSRMPTEVKIIGVGSALWREVEYKEIPSRERRIIRNPSTGVATPIATQKTTSQDKPNFKVMKMWINFAVIIGAEKIQTEQDAAANP